MATSLQFPRPGLRSKNELAKETSNNLRGTIRKQLAAPADHFDGGDVGLLKFHGIYQQEDRDQRRVTRQAGSQKQYMFMVRTKIPGGRLTAQQFLTHLRLATAVGNGTLRLTTRQDVQFHGILKGRLRTTLKALNEALVTSMGACGDVVRNVVTCPAPDHARQQIDLEHYARQISDYTLPRGRFYHEIWVDGAPAVPAEPVEPLYGKFYLPRKFKIGIAFPGDNCIDIHTHDLGFVPEVEDGRVVGFTLLAGGGLGMTHHKKETFPRLSDPIAFIAPSQLLPAVRAVVGIHRDFGDREERRHARLKYVVEEMGVPAFRAELVRRLGEPLKDPKPLAWTDAADHLGWRRQQGGSWYFGLAIENGRISDSDGSSTLTGLYELVSDLDCEVRLTAQQNLLLCGIANDQRATVEKTLRRHNIPLPSDLPNLIRDGLACPALPTCGLALAESERVFPSLLRELNHELERLGLADEQISVRMTGCPNGCARPYTAEIGFVGRTAGVYDIYAGGSFLGTRLGQVLAESTKFDRLVPTLVPLLEAFSNERLDGERFGDYCARAGLACRFELAAVTASL